jgi:hypothetical protein
MLTSVVLFATVLVSPPVVERVLGVVNGRPLLLSEVRGLEAVRGVSEEEALELLVDEVLMYDQASRTPQAQVTSEEEQRARAALYEKRPDLVSRVAAPELSRLLRRQLGILKYVEFRFRPQVRPSDEDLQAAYAEQYGGRPEAPAFDTVVIALRERLVREQLDQKLEGWIAELRKEADLRKVPSPQLAPGRVHPSS